jgi:elongation factor Ts
MTAQEKITELISKIGENISFRRFGVEQAAANEKVYTYVHGAGRIGVIVRLAADKPEAFSTAAAAELGKDLSMQVAASNPVAVDRGRMTKDRPEVIEKEKEIYFTQAQTSGKPEKVWPKIVEGKLDKFFKESTLMEQVFIRDPEISVGDRIKTAEKDAGALFTVVSFVRYELGAEE